MAQSYVPDAADIVWISFDPQTGHEQAGHRPAVVLSPAAYNAKTSRGSGRPGQEPGLAEKEGQAQRDHIGGWAGGSAR